MTDPYSKEELVLHGQRTPLCNKKKSSASSSARHPQFTRTYSVDNYSTPGLTDPESSHSSSIQAASTTSSYTGGASYGDVSSCSSPQPASSSITSPPIHGTTMHKSVTFTPTAPQYNGGMNGDVGHSGHSDSDLSGSGLLPKSPQESQWYTHPVHLERKGFSILETNPAVSSSSSTANAKPLVMTSEESAAKPAMTTTTTTTRNGTKDKTPTNGSASSATITNDKMQNGGSSSNGHHQHHHHHHRHRHRSSSARRSKSAAPGASPNGGAADYASSSASSSIDGLVREFFPVTLGAAYMLNSIPPSGKTLSPPPKALPQPNNNPWKVNVASSKHPKSPSRKKGSRPNSAHSSSSSASRNSVDKMYFMTAEAPHTAGISTGGGTVLLSSPYQSELARLRMERLRIEEDHLLEVKRNEELERIRGPQPKWYELKGPRFHYEAKKNNEILKNKPVWQELMDYRSDLERASKEYRKSYPPANQQLSSTT